MGDIRQHRVVCDFGVKDYYKYYKENNGISSHKVFSGVLRDFHLMVGDVLINYEYSFKMPSRMGVITTKKAKMYVKLDKNGNLTTNYPIDYKATKELWDRDPIAKEQRKKVRFENKHTNGYKYEFKYMNSFANFPNKKIYTMVINRKLKRDFSKFLFKYGEVDRGM